MRAVTTMFTLLAASAGVASADDKTPIKPFGTIEWNDNFGTVVAKYNATDGVKKCTRRAVKKAAAGTNAKARAGDFFSDFAKKFPGKDGKELRAFEHENTAELESVAVERLEFKITASFEPSAGFVRTDPTRVLNVGGKPPLVEPLILDKVELHAQGHEERSPKTVIIEKLEQKFGNIRDRNRARSNEDEPYTVEWSNEAHGPAYRRRDGECQKVDDKLEALKAQGASGGKSDSGKF